MQLMIDFIALNDAFSARLQVLRDWQFSKIAWQNSPANRAFPSRGMNNFLPTGLVFMALACPLGTACIITLHSGSFSTKRVAAFSPFRKLALRALVALSNRIIPVNEEQKTILLDYGL